MLTNLQNLHHIGATLIYLEFYGAIRQQQGIALLDIIYQTGKSQPNPFLVISFDRASGIENKFIFFDQGNSSLTKAANPDLRALKVQHDRDVAANGLSPRADLFDSLSVLFMAAMREFKPDHVDVSIDERIEYQRFICCRSHSGNYLRSPEHYISMDQLDSGNPPAIPAGVSYAGMTA